MKKITPKIEFLAGPYRHFYIRHARNITLDNIQINLAKPDARPTLQLEDVHLLKATSIKVGNDYVSENKVVKINSDGCLVNQ